MSPLPRPALAGALALALFLAAGGALAAGQVGEPAAPFVLESLDGPWHSLAQYADQVLVLCVVGYG